MQQTYNMPTIQQVIELVKNRPASLELKQISAALTISESWLDKFIAGKIEKPGYDKILKIVNYLNK